MPIANPDLAAALPNLSSLISSLRNSKDEVFLQWETRRQKLDHCYQLKLFEQDADKMFEWIRRHYALANQRLLEIGDCEQSTSMLLAEHCDFLKAANNTEVNISHVMTVAKRLREIGNYGKAHIESVAIRLDEEWRRFKHINEQRSRLLDLALSFHRKSHIYLSNAPAWLHQITLENSRHMGQYSGDELEAAIAEHERFGEMFSQSYAEYLSNAPAWLHQITLENSRHMGQYSGDELEAAIAEHERFGEMFSQSYAEAVGDGRSLTQTLKMLAGDAAGQNSAYKHAVDLIQQITGAHKELYCQWQTKKLRLHSRLALIAFETDTHRVLQWLEEHGDAYLNKNTAIGNNLSQAKVLQWLEEHGDAYLNKNTAIGNNLSQAKVLQRNHSHFRSVASNTYSNAEKLFTASNTIIESVILTTCELDE
ncbi:unnamed protein product [Gongylonema pulchrum]|uniref:CZB domain-containing protein n=1 Tax=Gongylonema pulchrum TaxID=637853 RepID=A0A183ED92_9BILA|nr:unnamed protein product [Gongylonema pulchrum]